MDEAAEQARLRSRVGWSERLRLGVGHASTVRPDPYRSSTRAGGPIQDRRRPARRTLPIRAAGRVPGGQSNGRITSGITQTAAGARVAFACNGEDTLAASSVYTLRATSCAEKAASGSNVGAVRGHTKLVCRGSNLALVTCQWILVQSNSSQIAPQGCELQREGDTDSWIDVAGNCIGTWNNVQSKDLSTNWSCAYHGVSLDHQMQMSLARARFPNNVETGSHSHWSLWVVLKTEC